ncbi:tetratricopeptide repeat protein [Porphyrobacter sp. AAP60]|uniref:tetratricopeptide repeat protein n=1 Tax=Porphyrobacter sp. AAP60 TaxID=1523423 RepID=UPI0012E1B651|nr:hypothetical protein [Porphyrobacter sp. AAP60]
MNNVADFIKVHMTNRRFKFNMEIKTPRARDLQIFEVRKLLAAGEFDQALSIAIKFVEQKTVHVLWYRLAAEAMTGLGRPLEALDILRDALERHQDDARLLRTARAIAFQHGCWAQALAFTEQILSSSPDDIKMVNFKLHTYLAMGRDDDVRTYALTNEPVHPGLQKAVNFEAWTGELRERAAPFVQSWEAALGMRSAPTTKISEQDFSPVTFIQYWSQGELPEDLSIIFNQWQKLAKELGLGEVNLFNKDSASAWIAEHAPEFSQAFASAFHYAMESDIFRIAYASRKPCLYVDSDAWPLPEAAEILRTAMRHGNTMLYFRAYRPWILNGLFLSYPTCNFIKLLVKQTRNLRFDGLPQNHTTIDAMFGPSRFNDVLKMLIKSSSNTSILQPEGVAGLSILRLDKSDVCFTHEAAVASVRPLFSLAYKTTEANWKTLGGRD